MKIDSSKLQRIFKYLTPSIGSPLKMAEFNSFLFDATENNLMVRIYNGTTESIVNMTGEFEPIRFAVDEFIYQVVNQLNGEINFELDDTKLIVDCGAKHYEFSTIDCELWQPIMTPLDTQSFDSQWIKLFNKTNHCVATDESRPIYTGYHVRDYNLFATDGYRAIIHPIDLENVSVPQREFDSILRCLDGEIRYNFDNNIYFECESDEFKIRYYTGKMDGEPFNAKEFFDEKESHESKSNIVFDDLQNDLKDILILSKQANKLGDGKFLLTITNDENNDVYFITNIQGLSNSRQKIDCEFTGDNFKIHMNPSYLMDFAKVVNGHVKMKILPNDEMNVKRPFLLYDESESKSLLMPMEKKT